MADQQSFPIDSVFDQLRDAVRPYPMAALFELAAAGHDSPFEQLVACMISIRTRDEITLPVAHQFFATARTPADVSRLSAEEIENLISTSSFPATKARQILAIACRLVAEHDGVLPCDHDLLRSFGGVGPKCANLVLGIACNQPYIGVDIHVHRITNRWGYVHTATPEQTMVSLHTILPRQYWVEINRLLVPFGKHICTGTAPRCSSCPLQSLCPMVGVTTHR